MISVSSAPAFSAAFFAASVFARISANRAFRSASRFFCASDGADLKYLLELRNDYVIVTSLRRFEVLPRGRFRLGSDFLRFCHRCFFFFDFLKKYFRFKKFSKKNSRVKFWIF